MCPKPLTKSRYGSLNFKNHLLSLYTEHTVLTIVIISVLLYCRYDVSGAQTWMVGRAYRGVVGYVEQVNPGSDPSERALCTNDCEVDK